MINRCRRHQGHQIGPAPLPFSFTRHVTNDQQSRSLDADLNQRETHFQEVDGWIFLFRRIFPVLRINVNHKTQPGSRFWFQKVLLDPPGQLSEGRNIGHQGPPTLTPTLTSYWPMMRRYKTVPAFFLRLQELKRSDFQNKTLCVDSTSCFTSQNKKLQQEKKLDGIRWAGSFCKRVLQNKITFYIQMIFLLSSLFYFVLFCI